MANKGEISVWGDGTPHPQGNRFKTIVPGGAGQSLALDTNGGITLIGAGPIAISPAPEDQFDGAAIGITHAIAIRSTDSSIAHWGLMPSSSSTTSAPGPGSPAAPATLTGKTVTRVTAGGDFCLAIANGELYRWGPGYHWGPGDGKLPEKGWFIEIAARNDYCLALREDGALVGWGGYLFTIGPRPAALTAALLQGWEIEDGYYIHPGPFKAIAAGNLQKDLQPHPMPHVLALKHDGTVVGWGAHGHGELNPPSEFTYKAIAAGHGYSLGIDSEHHIHHWGDSGARVLSATGAGSVSFANVPKGKYVSVGAAARHCSAVAGDQA